MKWCEESGGLVLCFFSLHNTGISDTSQFKKLIHAYTVDLENFTED